MRLRPSKFDYRTRRKDSPVRIVIYLAFILAGVYVLWGMRQGSFSPIGVPTPTATRSALSFAEEAEAAFSAGRLTDAVLAYQQAHQAEPNNVDYLINLTRIQTYAGDALGAADAARTAIVIAPESSMAYAVLAFALGSSGNYEEGETAAVKAIQLDGNNALAHAYYAEILTETLNWTRASESAELALQLNASLMDVHRVYGKYLEYVGAYEDAILQYKQAATINPNLPSLQLSLGLNYRALEEYEVSLEYFRRAQALDPLKIEPYLYISRTYFQTGDYQRATQWLEDATQVAIQINADSKVLADIFGRLGLIKHRSLDYEGAIEDLRCAIDGCQKNIDGKIVNIEGLKLADNNFQILTYYYTYTSVLAAYSPATPQLCATVQPLLPQIVLNSRNDSVILTITTDNYNTCIQTQNGVSPESTPDPNSTPTPTP
ncbi:MAG TPA: tetratricopeptide repeat protein [Anaerolineales bacterium]|nr:tetratricopeptide repeat protein [Anaerolineales bacterium]